MNQSNTGKPTAFLELKVPPLLLLALVAALIALSAWLSGWRLGLSGRLAWTLAALLAAFGSTLAAAGVWAFRRHRTTVDPRYPEQSERIVSDGIYAHTRNPMYLGFVAMLAGWALGWQDPLGLIWLGLFVVYLTRYQITPEERILRQRFGDEFERYCQRVRRWL